MVGRQMASHCIKRHFGIHHLSKEGKLEQKRREESEGDTKVKM
jgi:hypothetical protein